MAAKYFSIVRDLSGCSYLSWIAAAVHYSLLVTRTIDVPFTLSSGHDYTMRDLQSIWHTWLFRKMLRLAINGPFRGAALNLVNPTFSLTGGSGYVIAMCHTPWKRLLVQWCLEHDYALVVGNGIWPDKNRRIQKQGRGFTDLRATLQHLQRNGRLIIAFDSFNQKGCRLKFMGGDYGFSTVPVRLAAIADVPLIAAIPRLRQGRIDIDRMASFSPGNLRADPDGVMQTLVSLLEDELKTDPGIWPMKYHRYAQPVFNPC